MVTTLGSGGAERILVNTIKSISDKYDVSVLSFINHGTLIKEISNLCGYRYIYPSISSPYLQRVWQMVLTRWQKLFSPRQIHKKYIKDKYDIEIAWLEGIPTRILSGGGDKCRRIAWVHTDLSTHTQDRRTYRSLAERHNVYGKYDDIVAVSTEVKNAVVSGVGLKDGIVNVIYNIIDDERIKKLSAESGKVKMDKDDFNIVIVGSLLKVKAHLRLLESLSVLRQETQRRFHLYIIGDGPEKNSINSRVSKLDLGDVVTLCGFNSNPYPEISLADLLISVSYAEGFSSTVCEALILGTPVLVTDCAGMYDILGKSEFGMVVDNNMKSIADGLSIILNDNSVYRRYKVAAAKRGASFSRSATVVALETFLARDNSIDNRTGWTK